jgi:hypothetical protein
MGSSRLRTEVGHTPNGSCSVFPMYLPSAESALLLGSSVTHGRDVELAFARLAERVVLEESLWR